jgi:hypothetical protein
LHEYFGVPWQLSYKIALLMQNMDASIEAERLYLKDLEKNPYTTDTKYFIKAVSNILLNKIRSA